MSRPALLPSAYPHPGFPVYASHQCFSGTLASESFGSWAHRWINYLSLLGVPEDDLARRAQLLLLSLQPGSIALDYFYTAPVEIRNNWKHGLAYLQARFSSTERIELAKSAALNRIMGRGFRDEQHRGEYVQDLIDDFEQLAAQAQLDEESKRRHFVSCFTMFVAATRLLVKTTTLEEAFGQALYWEKVLVEKTTVPNSSAGPGGAATPLMR